ncbi:hypothetical protein YC2023_065809 [Brassica napus]
MADLMLDSASGYFYNQINGPHYDSKSDSFIYLCGLTWAGDATGSWVIQDDSHTAVKTSSDKGTKELERRDEKPKNVSAEEKDALKEAARKTVARSLQ